MKILRLAVGINHKRIRTLISLGVLAFGVAPAALVAATLTGVPMQGSMVMPMVSYHANDGAMHVLLDPTVPQLTPLLVSNPSDHFDPGDPWWDALDPNRAGLAFSRRYGFVMDTMSDPLPDGTAMWIRKLSGSPGLGAHRYASTAPKAFEPIFGSEGSTNALMWNGLMFHPCFTAPPGTNTYSATFEVYLVETTTGAEVPGSSSGPVVFHWSDVPDGRPTLNVATKVMVSWPTSTANSVLEAADSPDATVWTTVTNAPVTVDGQEAVVLEPATAKKFYRLRQTP